MSRGAQVCDGADGSIAVLGCDIDDEWISMLFVGSSGFTRMTLPNPTTGPKAWRTCPTSSESRLPYELRFLKNADLKTAGQLRHDKPTSIMIRRTAQQQSRRMRLTRFLKAQAEGSTEPHLARRIRRPFSELQHGGAQRSLDLLPGWKRSSHSVVHEPTSRIYRRTRVVERFDDSDMKGLGCHFEPPVTTAHLFMLVEPPRLNRDPTVDQEVGRHVTVWLVKNPTNSKAVEVLVDGSFGIVHGVDSRPNVRG
jgi:hypothetical protein